MFNLSIIEKKRIELEQALTQNGYSRESVNSHGIFACECSGGCLGSCEQTCQGHCKGSCGSK